MGLVDAFTLDAEEAMLLALVIRHRRRLLSEFRRKVRLAE